MIITQRQFVFTYPSNRDLQLSSSLAGYANVDKILHYDEQGRVLTWFSDPASAIFNNLSSFEKDKGYQVISKGTVFDYPYTLYNTTVFLPQSVDITQRIQYATYCGEEFDLVNAEIITTAPPAPTTTATPVTVDYHNVDSHDGEELSDGTRVGTNRWMVDDSVFISPNRDLVIVGSAIGNEYRNLEQSGLRSTSENRSINDGTRNPFWSAGGISQLGCAQIFDMDRNTGEITPAFPVSSYDKNRTDVPSQYGTMAGTFRSGNSTYDKGSTTSPDSNESLILYKDGLYGGSKNRSYSSRNGGGDLSVKSIGSFVWGKKDNSIFWNGYYIILAGPHSITKYKVNFNKSQSTFVTTAYAPFDAVCSTEGWNSSTNTETSGKFGNGLIEKLLSSSTRSVNNRSFNQMMTDLKVNNEGSVIVASSNIGRIAVWKDASTLLDSVPFSEDNGNEYFDLDLGGEGTSIVKLALSQGVTTSSTDMYIGFSSITGNVTTVRVLKFDLTTGTYSEMQLVNIADQSFGTLLGSYSVDLSEDGNIFAMSQKTGGTSAPANYGADSNGRRRTQGGVVIMKRNGNKYEYFGNKIFLEDLGHSFAPHVSLSRCDLGSSGTDYSDLEVAVRYVTTNGSQKVSVYKYDISQSKFVIADAGNATFTVAQEDQEGRSQNHNFVRNPQGNFPVALSRDAKSFVFPLGNHKNTSLSKKTSIRSYWTEDANVTADAPGAVATPTNFTIDSQPTSVLAEAGTTSHTFSVTASNDNGLPINYQWYRWANAPAGTDLSDANAAVGNHNFLPIDGAVLPNYTISASDTLDPDLDHAIYYCKVQAGDTTLYSSPAASFFYNMSITTQPQGTVVDDFTNPNRNFYVRVDMNPGGQALYQWQRSDDNVNFVDIIGNRRSSSYAAPSAVEANRYHRCIIELRHSSRFTFNSWGVSTVELLKTITSESARHTTT